MSRDGHRPVTMPTRLDSGSEAWFAMVGTLICDAARRVGLPAGLTFSLVERYTDGTVLPGGLVQGLRFDVTDGRPSFTVGVSAHERGDVTIEITEAVARRLNSLYTGDPRYSVAIATFVANGEMRVDGDVSPISRVLAAVHDGIVERTLRR